MNFFNKDLRGGTEKVVFTRQKSVVDNPIHLDVHVRFLRG
jgi:hypothetical protein